MKPITDLSQLDFKKQYTYSDYLTWQFSERVELIKGWLYNLGTAPRLTEKNVIRHLFFEMYSFFKYKDTEVYHEQFDVRLTKNKAQKNQDTDTVVQPDVCVICDNTKLDEAGCVGAPDLIIEILSDSTAKKDYNEKFNLYEENRVKEYWIVNPATQTIEVFSLIDHKYESLGLFNEKEGAKTVQGNYFPKLSIALKTIFS
jgi:Uma2 family endonuclease